MAYANTRELKDDVLFRASENTTGSGWNAKVVDYLNRVYRTLCSGASEFLPEYVEDWWWLRSEGVLTLLPALTAGTLTLTEGSTAITFTNAPVLSTVGYKLRVEGHPEVFEIATHTAAATAATLDSPWTGDSGALRSFRLMKVSYPLSAQVAALISPMVGFRSNPRIIGLSPERMDDLYPIPDLTTGTPMAFCLENEQTVRFSHGGNLDGKSQRIEYRYRPTVADLTDTTLSVPLLPLQWRHLLADMALTYVLLDKNDDRSNAVALAARTGLAAMLKENRRRIPKMDDKAGHIFPRGGVSSNYSRGPLRTESGLIIG